MSLYRTAWFLFMFFIVTPGFIFASSVEGIEFWEAADTIGYQLYNTLYFPGFIAAALSVPVTVMATLLPGSSSAAPLMGEMILQGVGIIFTFLFFILIRPPFYTPNKQTN